MRKPLAFAFGVLVSILLSGVSYAQSAPDTEIKVRLIDRLDTGQTPAGSSFSATVEETVRLDKKTVLSKGTTVKGTVTDVVSSGRLKRPASITLELQGLGATGISTQPLQIDGKSHAARNTALIGGGAAAGAILGAIAGGGKGAVIGTAAGAGAGTGTAYATGKKEIVLPSESELVFMVGGEPPAPVKAAPVQMSSNAPSRVSNASAWQDDPRDGAQEPERDNYGEPPAAQGGDGFFAAGIIIGPPPPPRVVYVEPSAPGPDFVWVQGYWYPEGRHYQWHEGYWTRPPYAGAYWVAPHHDGEKFFDGYWAGNRGRVEHDHRWDHDDERDFHDRDHDGDRDERHDRDKHDHGNRDHDEHHGHGDDDHGR